MAEAPRGYLVDTNILSRRGEVEGNQALQAWRRRYAGLIRVSVITIAEMHRGLSLLEAKARAQRVAKARHASLQRAAARRAWYAEVSTSFTDRVAPIDIVAAERWAEISIRVPSLRDADKAIAATALARGYGVATENLGDFRQAGVPMINPFDPGTWDADWDDDPVARLLSR